MAAMNFNLFIILVFNLRRLQKPPAIINSQQREVRFHAAFHQLVIKYVKHFVSFLCSQIAIT